MFEFSSIWGITTRAVMITVFVFTMMLLVDYLNVLTRGKMEKTVRGGRMRQYIMASFLGSTPGCLGSFMNVSFYVHGLLSFGAIVGGMIATSGDEAFVMLSLFPKEALMLFILLFLLGIVGAWIADRIVVFFRIVPCEECDLQTIHDMDEKHYFQFSFPKSFSSFSPLRSVLIAVFVFLILLNISGLWGPQTWSWDEPERIILLSLSVVSIVIILVVSEHYLRDHIWSHIVKKHVWRIFLWTFFALLFVDVGLQYWDLNGFVKTNLGLVLVIGALVGLIPESGPHFIFVFMFANGLIPFSVLLISSIVQDGHGLLPLLSYTIRDSVLIKMFNLFFALAVCIPLYLLGM